MLGFPETAEGLFVSGGQMANIVAHAVFRDAKTPWDMRRFGMRGPDGNAPQVRIYASSELHYCHEQAAELLGMGREAVRSVPVDERYRMRLDALSQMIAEDRARGDLPIAIVGTAGTVGTGAIDPIPALIEVARRENLWLHIDGAYGAFATLAESCPPELRALAEADSVACDPHKWLYAAIDAGVVLVREPGRLERSFAFHAAYLETADRGAQVDFLERGARELAPAARAEGVAGDPGVRQGRVRGDDRLQHPAGGVHGGAGADHAESGASPRRGAVDSLLARGAEWRRGRRA